MKGVEARLKEIKAAADAVHPAEVAYIARMLLVPLTPDMVDSLESYQRTEVKAPLNQPDVFPPTREIRVRRGHEAGLPFGTANYEVTVRFGDKDSVARHTLAFDEDLRLNGLAEAGVMPGASLDGSASYEHDDLHMELDTVAAPILDDMASKVRISMRIFDIAPATLA